LDASPAVADGSRIIAQIERRLLETPNLDGTQLRGVSNAKAKRELGFQSRSLEWMVNTTVARAI
jgi:hypothetical protein